MYRKIRRIHGDRCGHVFAPMGLRPWARARRRGFGWAVGYCWGLGLGVLSTTGEVGPRY